MNNKVNVLIVDDIKANREVLVDQLKLMGHEKGSTTEHPLNS
jgi:CheY-like chemotaxis protein